MTTPRSLFFVLLLTACPDPSQTAAGPTTTSTAPTAQPGGGGDGAQQPGGQGFTVKAGEGVFLRGSFDYAGEKTGRNRIDFVTIQQGAPPSLVYAMTLEERGPWQVEVPKDFGQLYILAFIDQGEDGPTPGDPATPMGDPISIGSSDIDGIELKLVDTSQTGAGGEGGAAGGAAGGPAGAPGGEAGGSGPAPSTPPATPPATGAEVGAPTPPPTP